jgi:hypothetical protein
MPENIPRKNVAQPFGTIMTVSETGLVRTQTFVARSWLGRSSFVLSPYPVDPRTRQSAEQPTASLTGA